MGIAYMVHTTDYKPLGILPLHCFSRCLKMAYIMLYMRWVAVSAKNAISIYAHPLGTGLWKWIYFTLLGVVCVHIANVPFNCSWHSK